MQGGDLFGTNIGITITNMKNINNVKYWEKFYKKSKKLKNSSFAEIAAVFAQQPILELGCGDGRDISYFHDCGLIASGIDSAYEDIFITKIDVGEYIKNNICVDDVYTRFFWHAISRDLQLKIIKWATNFLFIEARTTDDKFRPKTFKKHDRNFVDVAQLVKDLKDNNFEIVLLREGTGMSKYKGEDPHLVRIVSRRK